MTYNDGFNNPTPHVGHGQGPAGASLSDLLTAVKNVAVNIANLGLLIQQINGVATAAGLTGAAGILIKQGAGRVAQVAVVAETGSPTTGEIIDANSAGAAGPVIYTIPAAVGLYQVNLPFSLGLVVIPGAGNTVVVSYS